MHKLTINHKKVNISYFCITFTTWQCIMYMFIKSGNEKN